MQRTCRFAALLAACVASASMWSCSSSRRPAQESGTATTTPSATTRVVAVRPVRERALVLSSLNRERVNTLLLAAMRRSGIDCWIVMSRENNVDFVLTYLLDEPAPTGGHRNAYVLFDDGSDRLKRVAIGTYLFRTSQVFDRIIEYRNGPEPFGPSLGSELRQVIEEFKPRRIGVNQSRTIPMCDGLTVEMRKFLEEAIGPVYAARIVSAEPMIVDFLESRLPSEHALFGDAAEITRLLWEEVLAGSVIVPGTTSLVDLAWHMNDWLSARDLETWFTPIAAVRRPEGAIYAPETIVQPGDLIYLDVGILYAGLATDYQKNAYVLKPGESAPPPGLQAAYANALGVQDAVVELAKPGAVGYRLKEAAEALARSRGLQPAVYSHSVAIGGHGIGAFIATDWPDRWGVRATFPLRAGAYYSIESSATTAVPEWGGKPVTLATEEDMVLDDDGLRYVIPRQEQLYLISGNRRVTVQ